MYRGVFTSFTKDLSKFDPNELIIVTYDKSSHLLIFRQINHIVAATYLSPYFFPKKGFRVGVLTQAGYNKLLYNLNTLLRDSTLDEGKLIPDIGILGVDWYRHFNKKALPTPQKTISLKFVNVTNRVMTWLLCRFYNNNSRIIYKLVINEKNNERKRNKNNKSKQDSGAPKEAD